MSERVQLLLSDRILGMTLVPEGRIWNYGIGLTQLWLPTISYAMQLDTPLLFWAEEHRPAAFISVSILPLVFALLVITPLIVPVPLSYSSQAWRAEMTVPMSKIALLDTIMSFFCTVSSLHIAALMYS